MVLGKLDKYFNYAILAGAIGAFIYFGGFTGIGRKLGSGITGGAQAFADTIKFPTFNLFGSDLSSVTSENSGGVNYTELDKTFSKAEQEKGAPLIPSERLAIAREGLELDAPIYAESFSKDVSSGAITAQFADKYSFKPYREGTLDISNLFSRLTNTGLVGETGKNFQARNVSNFGGFGSAEAQTFALKKELEKNALLYPEWFS